MRYYLIQINNADGTPFATFTSFPKSSENPNGITDFGALQIEFDIPFYTLGEPAGAASIIIWGVSLQQIGQSNDFNGKQFKLYGGMQAGLPLANPAQQGLLCSGMINQAWGNWIGTNQYLALIVVSDGGLLDQKLNMVISWKAGQPLGQAVAATLAIACPDYTVEDLTSSNLILGANEWGYFDNMIQFAAYVKEVSQPLLGLLEYGGVDIVLQDKKFTMFDGTLPGALKEILFNDLIGQPTWIDPLTIQLTCVLRGDVLPSQYIKMPNTITTRTAPAGFAQSRNNSVFQGAFMVNSIRHVGNSREPDALAWATVIEASSPFGGNT